MKNGVFIGFFIFCTSPGCHTPKTAAGAAAEPVQQLHIAKKESGINKIVFLTFEVTETDSIREAYKFKLINTVFADGTLKKSAAAPAIVFEKNNFYCELSSAGKESVEMIKTPDPLNRIFEFPGDAGNLGKAVMKSKTGQFSIRFQYNENIKYLTIFKPAGSAPATLKKIYYATL